GELAMRWRHTTAARIASMADGHVVAFESRVDVIVLDAQTGELIEAVNTPCEQKLFIRDGVVFTWNTGCFSAFALDDRSSFLRSYPCLGNGILGGFAVTADATRWAAIC